MDKKHPIPPLDSPVEAAIKQLMEEVNARGKATIDGVIIHPSDLPTLGALITAKPLPHPSGGALTEAWKKHVEEQKRGQRAMSLLQNQTVTYNGQQMSGVSWDEVKTMGKTELEQQLEDSLWALTTGVHPATPEEIREHLPHLAGDTNRVRRIKDGTVLILCPCKVTLRFLRCKYSGVEGQCIEEVPMVEAGNALCVLHRTGTPWKEGSRFYRCSFVVMTENRTFQCDRVATMTQQDGRHMCSDPEHRT